jgi:hypothetical protein
MTAGPKVRLDLATPDFHATVEEIPGGEFKLQWDDHVVNEWTERHGSLSTALARLAAIAFCGEQSNWERTLIPQEEFEELALRWLEETSD